MEDRRLSRFDTQQQSHPLLVSSSLPTSLCMPSERLESLRKSIADDAEASNIDAPVASPPPTTANGTVPGDALYDTPPDDEQPLDGGRTRRPSLRASWYNAERAASRSRSAVRQYNKQRKADLASQQNTQSADLTDTEQGFQHNGGSTNSSAKPGSGVRGRSPAPAVEPRGRALTSDRCGRASVLNSRVKVRDHRETDADERRCMRNDLCNLPRSPTPGSTDCDNDNEGDKQREGKESTESQYTYIYETAGYETLAAYAAARLGHDYEGWEEKDIAKALEMDQEGEAHQVPAPQPETEIVMLETQGPRVGGGWVNHDNKTLATHLGKRAAEAGWPSYIKRIRTNDPNDTATEDEDDEEPVTMTSPPGPPGHGPPPPPPLRAEASRPPTVTREHDDATAPITLDGQPPSSSSSFSRRPFGPIRVRGPTHARLIETVAEKKKQQKKEKREKEEREKAEREKAERKKSKQQEVLIRTADSALNEPADESEDVEMASVPPPLGSTTPSSPSPLAYPPAENTRPTRTSASRVSHSYSRQRTHVGSTNDGPAPDKPNSPPSQAKSNCSPRLPRRPRSVLKILEAPTYQTNQGDRIVLPSRAAMKAARAEARARVRQLSVCVEPSSAPKASFRRLALALGQPDSQSSGRGNASFNSRSQSQSQAPSRRIDPVSSAKQDMVNFNRRCRDEGVQGLIESVTRQTSRVPRVPVLIPRELNNLLADDDEDYTHAEAVKDGKQPAHGRKKKPLARDVHGHRRQVLIYAKIHLFAYGLVEGIYQTRATYLMWAARVHEATWRSLFPNIPYEAATQDELEVMVNYIATLRGKVKERVRAIVEIVYEFDGRVVTQQDIQANLDRFFEIHPNSFHCTSYRPRQGHYESEFVARCIAASLFQGPNSVGVLYPDYFDDMPLTVVAFILAIMQFCIEEWQDGYFASRDLGTSKMLDKYETHLAGLKQLRNVAPRRMEKIQAGWSEYAFDYSGASFIEENKDRGEASFHAEFRADTPQPQAPNEPSPSPSSHSPSPEPKYDDNSRLTARSKGKGRAL